MLRDGKRIAPAKNDSFENEPRQTNPDVLRIVTEAVLKEIANPAANVSGSQNDNAELLRPARRLTSGRHADGSLLELVNAVADAVRPNT